MIKNNERDLGNFRCTKTVKTTVDTDSVEKTIYTAVLRQETGEGDFVEISVKSNKPVKLTSDEYVVVKLSTEQEKLVP